MSEFYDLLEEYLGQADALSDIRVAVRRLWFYDFDGYPTRVWQGQGRLFTSDGSEWLGSIDGAGSDRHNTPPLQDGRDGSSASYQFSITIPNDMDEDAESIYNSLKEDQARTFGRKLTCYLAIFKDSEGLRPGTPIVYFKELTMSSPKFSESIIRDASGTMIRSYVVSITARDSNSGRQNIPNRTYSDANQKEYARQRGVVTIDRGSEFLGSLANRTYQIP